MFQIEAVDANPPEPKNKKLLVAKYTSEVLENPLTDHEKVAKILDECKELLLKKGEGYNSGRVKMGDYYPRGILSVIDIMNTKLLRMYSLLESGQKANFESIEDTAKDLANYAAIFIAVSRGVITTPSKPNTAG